MSQAPINIVYPIDGASYPITDPDCKVLSAYFTASFATTCPGGPHDVKWGFDGNPTGSAQFYDQFSAQFVWKLPVGSHVFHVSSSCGDNKVSFEIT